MARRPSKHLRPPRPLLVSGQTQASKTDGQWITRTIPAGRSTKTYRCPYCQQTIAPGMAHLVAWPAMPPVGSSSGVDHRRHWHTSCWTRRP